MKRDQLFREIRRAVKVAGIGLELVREGSAHQIFRCGTVQIAVPRHRELGQKVALEIRGQLEPVLGKRWWR
jgi:hypothetical protein